VAHTVIQHEEGTKILVWPRPKQRNTGAGVIPAQFLTGKKIDQDVRTVSNEVNARAAPEGSGYFPQTGGREGNKNGSEEAMGKPAMIISPEEKLGQEIEVGQISDKDEKGELAETLEPFTGESALPPPYEEQECPQTGETVRDW
jgi:hypothetical protein